MSCVASTSASLSVWAKALVLAVCGSAALGADLNLRSDPPFPARNLLANPSFEEGQNGKPAHWKWSTATPDNFVTRWTDEGRHGKCVHVQSHTGVMSGYWNQSLQLEPDTEYVLTGWFRLLGGKLLCYAHGKAADGRGLDQRFYAVSMRNHFLVPVFLKAESMRGTDADIWHSLRIPFKMLDTMEWVTVSPGLYFEAGEVLYDDFRLFRAFADLHVRVQADRPEIVRVQIKTAGKVKPPLDTGTLHPAVQIFEKTLPHVSTEKRYLLLVTLKDGSVQKKAYPEEGQP